VRRIEWRTKAPDGTYSSFSNGRACKKTTAGARVPESTLEAGRCFLAASRTGEATGLVLTTVKSFVALSVRDRSSGNSPATIPHNSDTTTAVTKILPISLRSRDIVRLSAGKLAPLPSKDNKCCPKGSGFATGNSANQEIIANDCPANRSPRTGGYAARDH
jgi:hypothetical protein